MGYHRYGHAGNDRRSAIKEFNGKRADIPIVICTGFSEKISEERARELGISGYLMKPLIRREMAEMIIKALDRD